MHTFGRIIHLFVCLSSWIYIGDAEAQPDANPARGGQGRFNPPTFPVITEQPVDEYFSKNDPGTLNCKATGNPKPVITWYRDGELVETTRDNPVSHRMLLGTGQLFFLRVIHSKNNKPDVGVYYCNATNIHGTALSRNVTIKIAVLKDDFRQEPTDTMTAVGKTTILHCRPPRGEPDPKVIWRKDGDPVQTNSRVQIEDDGDLVINSIQKEDAGEYLCLAVNKGGEKQSKPAQISVLDLPSFQRLPKDVEAKIGQVVEFTCDVIGDPPLKVQWTKEDGVISYKRSQVLSDNRLRISSVEAKDEGVYVCSVENSAGSTKATARLTVFYPPTILTRPKDQVVAKGRTVTLSCVVAGNPIPTLFWRKATQGLMFKTLGTGHYSVAEDGTFRIDNVNESDSDEYICEALNTEGQASASAKVKVIEHDPRPPPIILVGPHNQTLPSTTQGLLKCQATGDPDPIVRWYKDSRPVVLSDPRITQLDSGTLQISDLKVYDSGEYVCKAVSETGETTWSSQLIVQSDTGQPFHQTPTLDSLPDPPAKPQLRDITDTTVHLAWQPGRNMGLSPVFDFYVEYFGYESSDGWTTASNSVETESYTVEGLQPNTTYLFLVRARNSYGVGLPSDPSDPVRTKAKRKESMQNIDVVTSRFQGNVVELVKAQAVNSSSITLSWRVLKAQNLIDGFYIRYRNIIDIRRIRYGSSSTVPVDGAQTTFTLTGLSNYQWYEICVLAYHGDIQSDCSSPVKVQTEEVAVLPPPSDIQMDKRGDNGVLITWSPYDTPSTNQGGKLKNYLIECYSEDKLDNCSQTVSIDRTRVVIKNMKPDLKYYIRVAVETDRQRGVWSKSYIIGDTIYVSDVPLISDLSPKDGDTVANTDEAEEATLLKEPWFIGVLIGSVGGSLWLILCVLTIWLCRRHKNRKMKQQRYYSGVPIRKVDESNRSMCYQAYGTKEQNMHCQNDLDLPPEFTALLQGKKESEMNDDNLYKTVGNCGIPELKTFYQKADPVAPYATTTLIQQQNLMKQRGLDHMFRPINQGYIQHSEGSADSCIKPDPSTDSNTDNSRPNTGVPHEHCDTMQSPTSDSGSHTTDENGLLIKQRKKNNAKNIIQNKQAMVNWADLLPPPPEHPPPSEMGDNPPHYSEVRGDNNYDRSGSPMSPVSFSQLSACSCPNPHTQTPVSGWNMPVYSDTDCPRCHSEKYYDPGSYCQNHFLQQHQQQLQQQQQQQHQQQQQQQRTQSPRIQTLPQGSNRSIPYSLGSGSGSSVRGNNNTSNNNDIITYQYSTPQRAPSSNSGSVRSTPLRAPSQDGSCNNSNEPHGRCYQGYQRVPNSEDYKGFMGEKEWGPGPAPPCRGCEQDSGTGLDEDGEDGSCIMERACQSSLPSLPDDCSHSLYKPRSDMSRGGNCVNNCESPTSEGADYAGDSDLEPTIGPEEWAVEDGSSVHSSTCSSGDGSFLTEADFASAVARAAEMSGLTVVGTTVCDPNAKSKKERRHRRPARPISPGYSTDSNYGSIDIVHRPYPKSQRKKQLQEQGKARQVIRERDSNSSGGQETGKENNSSSGVYDMPYSRPSFQMHSGPASPAVPARFSSLTKKSSFSSLPEGSTSLNMGDNSISAVLQSPREDVV